MRAMFDAQRAAFLRAGAPSLQQRRADLKKLGDAISRNSDRLAAAISADFGNRSRHETELGEVFPAQSAIRNTLHHLSSRMRPKRVSVGLELVPAAARILYQPVGVVGIISPWNYPFNLAIVPLVAALAAGNRAMLKPSELTPRTSDFLADLLGGLFPPIKVATVVGGPEVGQAFARLPFDHLLYTGSTAVGRLVMQAAAENLTPVTLELGGKSPCILGEDAVIVERGREHRLWQALQRRPNMHRAGLRHAAGARPRRICRTGDADRAKILSEARAQSRLQLDRQRAALSARRSICGGSKVERRPRGRDQSGSKRY